MLEWGPTIDSVTIVEEYMHLTSQIWDYAYGVVDAVMTEKFMALFVAHVVARISDPMEMIPAFDEDEDEKPKRLGRGREEGEELEEGGGDGGGGDNGDGGGGG